MQSNNMEGLAQTNAFLTSSNLAVMSQLVQMTITMNTMQAQLKTLSSAITNPTSTNINFYCWICGGNFTHGSKT